MVAGPLLPVVACVNAAWYWERDPWLDARSQSPPGHTLHWMVSGSYELTLLGRTVRVGAGDLVHYGPGEWHRWKGTGEAVAFYSLNFLAPDLPVSAPEDRVTRGLEDLAPWFARVHRTMGSPGDLASKLEGGAAAGFLVAALARRRGWGAGAGGIWGEIETLVTARGLYRLQVRDLADRSGYSTSALYKACRACRGVSPHQRLRDLRMAEARRLVSHSTLSIGEVAETLGYPRIHEFCREFRLVHGESPGQFRSRR